MGNLLVIDTDTAARGIVRGRLADAGHLVHEADDPDVGARAASEGDYDGVLLSVDCLGSGEEFCLRLAAEGNLTTTPLIAYSLLEDSDELVPRALGAGAYAVINPKSGPQLERIVDAAISAFGRVTNLIDRQRAQRVEQRQLTEQLGERAPVGDAPRPRRGTATPESTLVLDPGVMVRWCDRESWSVLGRNCVGMHVRDLVHGSGLERFVGQVKTVSQHGFPLELPSTTSAPGRVLGASVHPLGKGWRCVLLSDLRDCETSVARQEVAGLGAAGHRAYGLDCIEGSGPIGISLRQAVARRAADSEPVLLIGEAGTERTLLARVLHYQGAHGAQTPPIMEVRCSAHSSRRVEHLLFGSGQDQAGIARPGLFELLARGTLVLHDVESLSSQLQARVLGVLQSSSGDRTRPRVVATTVRDLSALAAQRAFHPELAALLMARPIHVPPLRNRGAELSELVGLRLEAHGLHVVDEDAALALRHYSWPGNLAELEDTLERVARTCQGGPVQLGHLPASLAETSFEVGSIENLPADRPSSDRMPCPARSPWAIEASDPISFEFYERQAIVRALHACRGDRLEAARMLRVGKSTLYRKIRRFGIE